MAVAHGKQQWREAGLGSRLEVRAIFHQHGDRVAVAFTGRPHQGRLLLPALLRVDLGAVRDQQLQRVDSADPRGDHQRGFAFGGRGIDLGAGLEQDFDHARVAGAAGERERGRTIARHRLGIGAATDQRRRRVDLGALRRPVQRRHAVRLRRVDVDVLLLQQRAHRGGIGLFDRVHQPAVACRRSDLRTGE